MEPRISEMPSESEIPLGWMVHKFGGVNVGQFGVRIVEDIIKASIGDNRVAIVCSAMEIDNDVGKIPDLTNRLGKALEAAIHHHSEEYLSIVEAIGEVHVREASELIRSTERLGCVKEDITDECNLITRLIGAAQILGVMSPRVENIIIGAKERLSCILMTALLQDRGIDAEYINPEGIMDNYYTTKSELNSELCHFVIGELMKKIQECRGRVPVVTGYFGMVSDIAVGRDYADLCAAMLAVGLGADELQVWKQVDGIFTADPTTVSTAQLIPKITLEEAAELTYYGIEILHPFAMELATKARTPIRLMNVHNSLGEGTIICDEISDILGDHFSKKAPKRPTAITIKNGTVAISIHSNKRSLSCGFFASIFSTLGKWRLTVDLISTSETHVSVALHSIFCEDDLREAIKELKSCGTVQLTRNLAIVSLVGRQMKHLVGIAGYMFSALAKENVNVEMISQGASEINISCVIKEKDAARAMSALHTKMFLHQMALLP